MNVLLRTTLIEAICIALGWAFYLVVDWYTERDIRITTDQLMKEIDEHLKEK